MSEAARREIVFCHGCENEWYRDEHGLVCPECNGDFTEIVEGDGPQQTHMAPDPDEDDIDMLGHGGHQQQEGYNGRENQQQAQPGGGLFGLIGNVLGGFWAAREHHSKRSHHNRKRKSKHKHSRVEVNRQELSSDTHKVRASHSQ